MSKTKMIIDTDPGIDDAMAIFYALLDPRIDVIGMTTIFGNVTVDIATRNALVLAEMAGQTIPVARGADRPLVQPPNPVSDYVHGVEGFGDIPPITPKRSAEKETAAEFICNQINANPGEIVLCPVGPLTNIALALEHDPSITKKVKSVVLMGGGINLGNITDHAEANIWNDPHAADVVFAADWPVTMVGLDVTTKVTCLNADFAEAAKHAPKLGGFLAEAAEFYIKFYLENTGLDGCSLHDPAAIIAAMRPDLFTVEKHPIRVIVEGDEIGRTAVAENANRPEAHICMGLDAAAVKQLFLDGIKSGF